METTTITNALLSVSNKEGLEAFARTLSMKFGVKIFATGGTFKFLESLKIPARKIEELTGMPEMLGGRVKTLHPAVFAGILARRDCPEDLASLAQLNLPLFDLVVVNLYPFAEVVRKKDVNEAECIENIDIGGVSLLRAGAKNFSAVTVVSSP
ncbi:MAG: bifunctional phosphoribosylaminoimidazolecarboxamide formyltransferase/IMP cyclohydrolase, partial [Candidatus Sumerlaeia bacterium]|nr:bifunctional phosphoribosylaminoimidazolecarboxamide formyltransferase/IMP cyclohydrolase [Candidatus Sumerlaeia bacterium]